MWSITVIHSITATITVTDSGGCSGTATVEVTDPAIAGPNIVQVGHDAQLSASGLPGAHWESSDNTIATVGTDSGLVHGVTIGTVTITANVGGCIAHYTVQVGPPDPVVLVSSQSYVEVGKTTVDMSVSGGTPPYTWQSSQSSIASAAGDGDTAGNATGISPGTTAITATDSNGIVSNAVNLTVFTIVTHTVATARTNGDSTRKTVGVGEIVNCSLNPPIPSATWNASGTGVINLTLGTYTAGDIAESEDVTVTVPGGVTAKVTFTVKAPMGTFFENVLKVHAANGSPNSGFTGHDVFSDTDVAWDNVTIGEEKTYAWGTGGFILVNGQAHEDSERFLNALSIGDLAFFTETWLGSAFSLAGTAGVTIPMDYKVNGQEHDGFYTENQLATSNAQGTCTISKNGTSMTSLLTDADINDPFVK